MMISKQKNGGCRDQIKKLVKEKSMKEEDPNGLKKAPILKNPSSFKVDASKGKLQVFSNPTSSNKIKSMNNSENPISGLKPVRSSMKKNSGAGLHPTVNSSRDTCASTVKIVRYSESLDLDEANGASNQKLCSYKYCSLHNQKKHEVSLPALKCFREETAGSYLHSQSDSSQRFEDFLGQTQGIILESGVEACKFTPRQENTLSTSNHAGADSKLSTEADSNQLPEAVDVKVDDEIQRSTTFSYDNDEKFEESANRSLQSKVEIPTSPKELLEENLEIVKVYREEEHDIKVNVEIVGCCELSKHETNYESQQGIRSNYDEYGDISDGLKNEKENLTNSASFISENPLAELTNRPKAQYSTTKRITAENQENARQFNPRHPRFLPMKSARKRNVALLVAAFESIIQQEQCTTVP